MLYNEYLQNKRAYQEVGSLFLLERKHACLYYKPGKGKTYPTIDALRDVDKSKNGEAKVLILSTADAIKNMWKAEIDPQKILPENTVMMSLTKAIQENTKRDLLNTNWDLIIIDECHKIKSHSTKSSKLVYALSKRTEYVWGLSGTPRGNSDLDIYCQFHNMCVGDWGNISYTAFVEQFCDIDIKYFNGVRVNIPLGISRRYKDFWNKNIEEFTQRIGYDDEDNMPDLVVNVEKLPFVKDKFYKDAEEGVIELSEFETTMTKLTAIQKLHQIANGFLYYDDDNDNRSVYKIRRNEKLDWLKDNLCTNSTIVYRFAEDYFQISEELNIIGLSFTDNVEKFKNKEADILLLQCSRCESFNLQQCSHIIFYTLDYSFIKYDQMIHRIWRMGQKNQCKITILLFDGSVENKIWNAVKNKQELSELFMAIKGE